MLSVRCKPIVRAILGILFVLCASTALAQNGRQKTAEDDPAMFVLNATGSWGDAQDRAVRDAGGTVTFRHAVTGIGVVQSLQRGFLERALASGAFAGGDEDGPVPFGPASGTTPDEVLGAPVNGADEPFVNASWNLTAIEAPGAWALGYDGEGVRVAIIDGGICSSHQDLDANIDIAASRSFVPGKDFDADGAGFRRACHLAGIVAAEDNGFGTVGIAPHATIVACKVLERGTGTFEALIQAILYASDPVSEGGGGADIIVIGPAHAIVRGHGNAGTGDIVSSFARAVNYAHSRDVLVVAAAGDGAFDLDHTGSTLVVPAQSGTAIGVAATGPLGYAVGWPNGAADFMRPAVYSNYGSSAIWLSAPGGDNSLDQSTGFCRIPRIPSGNFNLPCYVYDMVPAPGYVTGSNHVVTWDAGTAVAAAHVGGVAALVMQKYPGIAIGALKTHLARTANHDGGVADDHLGHGFVNARRAVADAPESLADPVDLPVAIEVDLAVAPQPVRDAASFTLSLSRAGHVRLEVVDIAGRSVARVFDGVAPAGRSTVAWNGRAHEGRRLSPGAYFATVTTQGGQTSKRLVLLGR